MNEGVSLHFGSGSCHSVPHPRPVWWRRVLAMIMPRPDIDPASLVTVVVKIPDPPEPQSLVGKLRAIAALKPGDPLPHWLYGENNNWAVKFSAMCNEAADDLEQRRRWQPWHKIMTRQEYFDTPIIGWHEVYHNIDGFGGVGIRYLGG